MKKITIISLVSILISLNTFSQEKIDSNVCKSDSIYFWYSPYQSKLIYNDSLLKEIKYFRGMEFTETSNRPRPNGMNKDYIFLGKGSWCDISTKNDKLAGYHARLKIFLIEEYFKKLNK